MLTDAIANWVAVAITFIGSAAALSFLVRRRAIQTPQRARIVVLAVAGFAFSGLGTAIIVLRSPEPGVRVFDPTPPAVVPHDSMLAIDSLSLVVHPRMAVDSMLEGINLASRGRLSEAIAKYSAAIALDSSSSSAFGYRGFAEYRRGRLQVGMADTRTAIALDSTDGWHHYNFSLMLWDAGDRAEAISELRRAVAIDPSFAETAAGDPQFRKFRASPEFRLITAPIKE